MASGKTKKKKTSTKITVIKSIVASVLILSIVGYFVYISGIFPRYCSAITITETNANGVASTLGEVSVIETNLHFQEIFNMYRYMYSMDAKMLDEKVSNEPNASTYREIIMEQVAEDMMKTLILERAAKADGYDKVSGAARYADMDVEMIRANVKLTNFQSADQYLQQVYGTGMSVRDYKEFMMRDCLFQEYQQYLSQFKFPVTTEQMESEYKSNSTQFEKLDFNYYYFVADTDENGKTTTVDAAKERAQKVVDKAKDSESFRDAVMEVLVADKMEASLETFADGANPTEHTNYDPAGLANRPEPVQKFFETAKPGDKTVIVTDDGAYAIILNAKKVDDTPTVTYRTLTLNNEVFNKEGATLEEIAAGAEALKAEAQAMVNGVTTAENFASVVKKNSSVSSEIISGGFNPTVTADKFDKTVDVNVTDLEVALGQWLFAEDRVTGNTYVETSADNSTVTIYFFEDNLPAWMAEYRSETMATLADDYINQILATGPSYKIHYKTLKYLSY